MVNKLLAFVLISMIGETVNAVEAKSCPIKSVKQKFEFFIGSYTQTEKLSQPRDFNGVTIYFEKTPQLTNEDIEKISAPKTVTNVSQMNLTFTTVGALKLEKVTKENVGRSMSIVVDDTIISVPVVQAPVSGGLMTISYMDNPPQIKALMSKVCPL